MERRGFLGLLAGAGAWLTRPIRTRGVRIVHGALPCGPGMIDLATGEEIGRDISTAHTDEMLAAKPGDTLHLRSFLRDASGKYYVEDWQYRDGWKYGQVASEILYVTVAEVRGPWGWYRRAYPRNS